MSRGVIRAVLVFSIYRSYLCFASFGSKPISKLAPDGFKSTIHRGSISMTWSMETRSLVASLHQRLPLNMKYVEGEFCAGVIDDEVNRLTTNASLDVLLDLILGFMIILMIFKNHSHIEISAGSRAHGSRGR